LLLHLQSHAAIVDSGDWAARSSFDHGAVMDVIKSLQGSGFVEAQSIKRNSWILTAEGESYAVRGSPEFQVFQAVPPEGISRVELEKKLEASVFKIGTGKAMKNKWLESLKGGKLLQKVQGVTDEVKLQLLKIRGGQHVEVPDIAITDLKNRKLIESRTWVGYSLKKGPKYAPKRVKPATDLTRELLQSGEWKEWEFKPYNYKALGQPTEGGHLHPLLKVRTQFRSIFLEMGFEEMPTNNFVESSFWNFDALFQPQMHPARDSHDTFFLKGMAMIGSEMKLKRTCCAHTPLQSHHVCYTNLLRISLFQRDTFQLTVFSAMRLLTVHIWQNSIRLKGLCVTGVLHLVTSLVY
jgi:phenylalanyl-tRNA synthetase alpha chain